MRRTLCIAACLAAGVAGASADQRGLVLLVRDAPAHGIVLGRLRLPVSWPREQRHVLRATAGGEPIPAQLLPPFGGGREWLAALKLPRGGDHELRLEVKPQQRPAEQAKSFVATNRWVAVRFDAGKMHGLPGSLRFAQTKKAFDTFAWNDRLHHRKLGGFLLRYGPGRMEVLATGPICTVVRTSGTYAKADGERPESKPQATYDWVLFHDLPLLFVRARITQAEPQEWHELHFLELSYPDESFGAYAGGEPTQTGRFAGTKKGFSFSDWAMLRDGRSAVAMLRAGRMLFHDGRGAYGTYLHAHSSRAWQGWKDTEASFSAWLWVGSAEDPVAAVRRAARHLPAAASVEAVPARLVERLAALRREPAGKSLSPSQRMRLHGLLVAENHVRQGAWSVAEDILAGRRPPRHLRSLPAGDLSLELELHKDGVRNVSLVDLGARRGLAAKQPAPLFVLTMRHAADGRLAQLRADRGWKEVTCRRTGAGLRLTWAKADDPTYAGVRVSATARGSARPSRLDWTLRVHSASPNWGTWRVRFPQLSIGPFARRGRVLVPQAAGVVKNDAWRKSFRSSGTYPSGWTAMPFVAAYDTAGKTGIYVAVHDPNASTKDVRVDGDGERRQVGIAFDHPAPNMGRPGTGFTLSGRGVWQLFRGDWFDASMIYRDWVRREAKWWPKLGPDGREDTPRWMRELCVWGLLGGGSQGAVQGGKAFVDAMDMPCGFHWYNWHRIPFDNDYPHYFPPKEGFAKAVAEIQTKSSRPAYVMPYINGRLWDTRDKGAADFEFTKLAKAAATKNAKGEPYTETYRSKEADGSPVRLAAMCPATRLWQDRVHGIVLRLLKQEGCKAVYIDQVAAARPRLCFDAAHGHPLGGGGWWVDAYGEMLTRLRKDMPPGCMLTTECNAEPYVRWFDGYLTWHWQYDGQVPAFPAVYGGAIQMFGRAYRGGPTKDLALRMKAGQQLCFGEQIGWIGVDVAKEPANAAFLRQVARVRHHLRRHFYAGQMARPPRLIGDIPAVTADWQWSGVWPVTTDAVLTGAWELPRERKLAMIFANVSDEPITARLAFDAAAYGLGRAKLRVAAVTADGPGEAEPLGKQLDGELTFQPRSARAYEIVAPASPQPDPTQAHQGESR